MSNAVAVELCDTAGNVLDTVTVPYTVVQPQAVSPGSGIDLTGTTDMTAKLQTWLAAHPWPNFMPTIPSGATIRLDGTVQITKPLYLTATGAKFVRKVNPSTVGLCMFAAMSDNVLCQDLNLQGPTVGQANYNAATESQHGFGICETFNNITLRGTTTIRGFAGDCVYVGVTYGNHTPATNVSITGKIDFAWAGRHGISVCNGDGFTLQATGSATEFGRDWFDLEPASEPGSTRVANNVLVDGLGSLVAGWSQQMVFVGGGGVGPIDNVTFQNIVCQQPVVVSAHPAAGYTRHNWTFRNIMAKTWANGGPFPQFDIINTRGLVIEGNSFSPYAWAGAPTTNQRLQAALRASGCPDAIVSGNSWG